MEPDLFRTATGDLVTYLLVDVLIIAGLIILSHARRTLAWYAMALGILLHMAGSISASIFNSLQSVSEFSAIIMIIAGIGPSLGLLFFLGGFFTQAFYALRVHRRPWELEYLCNNIAAEISREQSTPTANPRS